MPVKGKIRQQLSIENIHKRVTDQEIYKYYLGGDFPLNKAFHSPFRKDEHPSFSIINGKDGKLHHLDYADSHLSGDVFNFVCQLFNISHQQALAKIDFDMGLKLGSPEVQYNRVITTTPLAVPKEESIIQVVSRRFNTKELKYWNDYHITSDMLKNNEVYAIKELYLNRRRYPLRNDLCFGYLFYIGDKIHWKIYWPHREKQEKWIVNNVPNTHMSGMDKIKEGDSDVLVTKSKKDEIFLSIFIPRVVSVQHETVYAIDEANLKLLMTIPHRWINFDSDDTGIKASKYYNQYGFKWINCPTEYKDPKGKMIKDFADLGKHYGIETVMAYFKRKGLTFK